LREGHRETVEKWKKREREIGISYVTTATVVS
jgi:hypothetical protein